MRDIIDTASRLGEIYPDEGLVLTKKQKALLETQAHQAAGFSDQCTWAIEAIGLLLASVDGNVTEHTVTQTGYAVSQLAEYAHTMREIESNANHLLRGEFGKVLV